MTHTPLSRAGPLISSNLPTVRTVVLAVLEDKPSPGGRAPPSDDERPHLSVHSAPPTLKARVPNASAPCREPSPGIRSTDTASHHE